MTRILALIDGSIYAQSVCDHAAWAATRAGAAVELLHVLGRRDVSSAPIDLSGNLDIDDRDTLLAELAQLDEQRAKLAQQRGRLILEQAKARLLAAGVADVTTKLRHGDIVETRAGARGGCRSRRHRQARRGGGLRQAAPGLQPRAGGPRQPSAGAGRLARLQADASGS